jgi:hypothetical protein
MQSPLLRLSDLLNETFASDALPDVWLTTLENKRRNNGESLTDLTQTVMELMTTKRDSE